MGILERLEEKIDLLIKHYISEKDKSVQVQRGKRNSYPYEISNAAISNRLHVPYIGNKIFCRIAEMAGLEVTYHGTHPYIKLACFNVWVETWKREA